MRKLVNVSTSRLCPIPSLIKKTWFLNPHALLKSRRRKQLFVLAPIRFREQKYSWGEMKENCSGNLPNEGDVVGPVAASKPFSVFNNIDLMQIRKILSRFLSWVSPAERGIWIREVEVNTLATTKARSSWRWKTCVRRVKRKKLWRGRRGQLSHIGWVGRGRQVYNLTHPRG